MDAMPHKVRWGRVLAAVVATHLLNVVVSVVAVVLFAVLTNGGQTGPDGGGFVDRIAGQIAIWAVPVLTLPAAAWVARTSGPAGAALNGVLVGALVAAVFGLVFFWPSDVRALVPFALMIVAGPLGGLAGCRRTRGAVQKPGLSRLE